MKRFISIILAFIFVVISICFTTGATKDYSINCQEEKITFENKDILLERVKEQEKRQEIAHQLANKGRELNLAENHTIILKAKEIWQDAEIKKLDYQNAYKHMEEQYQIYHREEQYRQTEAEKKKSEEATKWANKEAEYPYATYIWKYLKNLGYNDYVCAGIMGNLMTEVGGQTLNIQYWLYGNGYYGMCQWNKAYPSVWGTDLATQCNFLRDTIQYEFNTYGRNYWSGFNYQSFLSLTNARNAALAFAKVYERCGSSTYGIRQNNAEKAYNYFVN